MAFMISFRMYWGILNDLRSSSEIREKSFVIFFYKLAIPGLFFLYFRLFNIVDSKQMFNKFCQWLDSNRGPLVSEATALPTEPQPLPIFRTLYRVTFLQRHRMHIKVLYNKMMAFCGCCLCVWFLGGKWNTNVYEKYNNSYFDLFDCPSQILLLWQN